MPPLCFKSDHNRSPVQDYYPTGAVVENNIVSDVCKEIDNRIDGPLAAVLQESVADDANYPPF